MSLVQASDAIELTKTCLGVMLIDSRGSSLERQRRGCARLAGESRSASRPRDIHEDVAMKRAGFVAFGARSRRRELAKGKAQDLLIASCDAKRRTVG